jgi:hypothetical protein
LVAGRRVARRPGSLADWPSHQSLEKGLLD